MIAKGIPNANGARLARYMITGKFGERAELWELRGFAAPGIVDAFRSVHVMAQATKCRDVFFHVTVRNPEGDHLSRAQWEQAANRIERILKLDDQPRAIAFHTDAITGHEHMHLAWSRICLETLTAKPLPFFKTRLKTISRELEDEFGLTPVRNHRESSIQFAPTRAEEQQARRLGVEIGDVRETIRACFDQSDCGRSFQCALASHDLILASGDQRDYLVLDRERGLHALGKRILGISAAVIRHRLADITRDQLPSVETAREIITARQEARSDIGTAGASYDERVARKSMTETKSAAGNTEAETGRAVGEQWTQYGMSCEQPKLSVTRRADEVGGELSRTGTPQFPESIATAPERDAPLAGPPKIQHSHEAMGRIGRRHAENGLRAPDQQAGEQDQIIAPSAPHGDPTAVRKRPGFGDSIRRQFRALVKHLTGRRAVPTPKSRSRREETHRDFRAAALTLFRRVREIFPFESLNPSWEPFTWLRLWEYNDPASIAFHDDYAAPTPSPSHAPHL